MAKKHLKPAKPAPAVKAIHVTTDSHRRAFAVVDAVDYLEFQIAPYRAVEALAINEKAGAEESLGQLRRSDLAALLCVLTTNLEKSWAEAREVAAQAAKGVAA